MILLLLMGTLITYGTTFLYSSLEICKGGIDRSMDWCLSRPGRCCASMHGSTKASLSSDDQSFRDPPSTQIRGASSSSTSHLDTLASGEPNGYRYSATGFFHSRRGVTQSVPESYFEPCRLCHLTFIDGMVLVFMVATTMYPFEYFGHDLLGI